MCPSRKWFLPFGNYHLLLFIALINTKIAVNHPILTALYSWRQLATQDQLLSRHEEFVTYCIVYSCNHAPETTGSSTSTESILAKCRFSGFSNSGNFIATFNDGIYSMNTLSKIHTSILSTPVLCTAWDYLGLFPG